jgi:hypothetical protein
MEMNRIHDAIDKLKDNPFTNMRYMHFYSLGMLLFALVFNLISLSISFYYLFPLAYVAIMFIPMHRIDKSYYEQKSYQLYGDKENYDSQKMKRGVKISNIYFALLMLLTMIIAVIVSTNLLSLIVTFFVFLSAESFIKIFVYATDIVIHQNWDYLIQELGENPYTIIQGEMND